MSSALHAQPQLDEILVTAQKRTESLQEAPISLAAFDSSGIERFGITNLGDIQNLVPNLSIIPFGVSPTTLRIFIRGVGGVDSQITQDPSVGVYLDGVYMARNSGLAMDVADIERIEVLRGPQGTLYGRNTTGGTINMHTSRPSDQFEFSQLVSYGRFNEIRLKTTLNVPVNEQVAVKFAYQKHDRDGWIKNIGAGEDFHSFDRQAMRGDLRWLISDRLTLDYAWDRSESDFGGSYYHLHEVSDNFAGVLEPQRRRLSRAELPQPYRGSSEKTTGHSLTLSLETIFGEIKSITSYRELEQDVYQDFSANPDILIFTNDPFELDQEQWTQELQVVGTTENGLFDYIAGIYYFSEKGEENAVDEVAIANLSLPRNVEVDNEAWAIYGQMTWHIGENSPWSITLGGRYTRDQRKANNNIDPEVSETFNNFTPSITVGYAFDDHTNFYGKVVSGYKSGGFNLRQADFTDGFDEETLISYELGWKSELLQRRLRFNGAVFYSDYDDIQLDILIPDQPDPTLTRTDNAGKARIYGLETDITALLTNNLQTSLSYAYLDSSIRKVDGDDARLFELPNAPQHSITAGVDWTVLQLATGDLNLTVDYAWRDEFQTGVRELVGINVGAYGVANARLTFSGDDWFGPGHYRAALWVKNAFDREYFSDTFGSFAPIHANRVATYGDPRTVGVDLEYQF